MNSLSGLTSFQILLFAMVLLRSSAFVVSASIFSSPAINPYLKILFSLSLTMIIFPLQNMTGLSEKEINEHLLMLAGREVLVGLALGLMTRLFFFTVGMVGELLSVSLGLGSAQIYNPISGHQSQILDQFYTWLAMMIFLALGGAETLIQSLSQSFEIIPFMQMKFSTVSFSEFVTQFSKILVVVIQISSPILISMLLANLAMGILGRTVPQINVLVTSFPVSIILGLFVLILITPYWFPQMNALMDSTFSEVMKMMKAI